MTRPLVEEFDAEAPVIDAIQRGDRTAFDHLVRRWSRWVRGVVFGVIAQPADVDDVCQQVWATVWRRIDELRDSRAFKSWLFRIARNAALDSGRRTSRQNKNIGPVMESAKGSGSSAGADASAVLDEQSKKVIDALQELPAMYREPLVLKHISGWNYRQIADVLQMPVDSVETRLVRARRMLRERLANDLAI